MSFWKCYLRLSGWKTSVSFPYHHLNKFIIIVGPHTSNLDFIIGLAYRAVLGLGYVKFLGKEELFKAPFGWIFRLLGGIPVDRHQRTNLVDAASGLFTTSERFALALSPEGTRKKVEKLRTGFYYIACQSQVPIVMAGFDYDNKTIVFGQAFHPTDIEKDLATVLRFYSSIRGRHPAKGIAQQ